MGRSGSWLLWTVKVGTPLISGFILGSAISLYLFPLPDWADDEGGLGVGLQASPCPSQESMEAVIQPPLKRPPIPKQKPKLQRPRFYATELGILDKLFLAILSDPVGLRSRAPAINRTASHHVSKLAFFHPSPLPHSFLASDDGSAPLNIHLFPPPPSEQQSLFALLGQLHRSRLVDHYDWFFVAPDSLYVKAFKLFEFVSHVSVGEDLVLGLRRDGGEEAAEGERRVCEWEAGLLLSRRVVSRLFPLLPACRERVEELGGDASLALAECLAKLSLECSEAVEGKELRGWRLGEAEELSPLFAANPPTRLSPFNAALTVGPVSEPGDFYALHQHACLGELHAMSLLSSAVEEEIRNATETESWPPGLPPPARPKNRYEAFRWEAFTPSRLYPSSTSNNYLRLDGVDAEDVDAVTKAGRAYLSERETGEFDAEAAEMSLGYRRFDPTRGMDYILHFRSDSGQLRRVELVRPLSRAEIVPVPYVTEKKEVLLVVPVHMDEVAAGRAFLDRFAEVCLDAGDDSRLLFVLVHPQANLDGDSISGEANAAFAPLIQDIRLVRKQFGEQSPGSSKVRVLRLRGLYQPVRLLREVVEKNGEDQLYLAATPWAELHIDFVNRVRIHTIQGFQVFSPIPFAQFNPAVTRHFDDVLRDKPNQRASPGEISVHKTQGRFDLANFDVTGFYGSDLRRELEERAESAESLAELFAPSHRVTVMRAIEPSLKLAFHELECPAEPREERESCQRRSESLQGSRAQLATFVRRSRLSLKDLAILAKKNRAS